MLRAKEATYVLPPSASALSQISMLQISTADTTGQSTTTRQPFAPKKRQHSESSHNKKHSVRKKAKTPNTDVVASSTTAKVELKPGLEGAPIEVWHHILSHLPTSQVARVSLTSKTLSGICRSWPRWRIICEKNKLGIPRREHSSFMALVCSESYYICDMCDGRSTGVGRGVLPSQLPLTVRHRGDRSRPWRLCHRCRSRYYKRFEETQVLKSIKLSQHEDASMLKDLLGLRRADLDDLDPERYERGLEGRRIPLYSFFMATMLALDIHGGNVGVNAAADKYAKEVQSSYRLRKKRDAASWKEAASRKKK